jgi:DNA-binding XRE family transcriptional regulator
MMEHNQSKPVRKNRVRELRENRLMTQAQLARKAKVALRTIHSVEKGMNCRMDTKRKILLALGLRFEDKDQVFPPASAFDLAPLQQGGQPGGESSPTPY